MSNAPLLKYGWYQRVPFRSLFDRVAQQYAGKVMNSIGLFIHKGERILDIGSGGGWVGEKIQSEKGADVTLLDVADFNQTKVKLVLYDGIIIPFTDNSFDASLLTFVLHHCENPVQVLQEAARVSKDRVIILEDTFVSRLDKIFVCINDIVTNLPGFFVKPFNTSIPFHFKRVSEWQEVFERLNLKIVHQEEFQSLFVKRVLFVVQK